MARSAPGQVVARKGKNGDVTWAIRFRAYGQRRYVTTAATSRDEAQTELENTLADVRRGIWRPPSPTAVPEPVEQMPTFTAFASEWLARKEAQGLGARTLADYRWSLELHLLPNFGHLPLDRISKRMVDEYAAAKLREGALSAATINKTISRLASILGDAVEYDVLVANVAAGRKRRLKAARPRRAFVMPEQLMALLKASEPILHKRGRPLLATLAGAGLRIQEALDLHWSDVNLPRATLSVGRAKTEAGIRTVDLTPALRSELTVWRATSRFTEPTDLVFPTLRGGPDCRQNVRRRLLVPAIEKANTALAKEQIEPIGSVGLHGLRRTFASIRTAAGDDPVYVASQLGHSDPGFSLRVYAQAVRHRERLTAKERKAYDAALEWAQMGTTEQISVTDAAASEVEGKEKGPVSRAFSEWAVLGSNQ